ncbi:MAG: 2-polyprenyl-3-methyl-6-methoxy-1,4-benzoquinone monooxygenase [Pseudomonadota bacterium]
MRDDSVNPLERLMTSADNALRTLFVREPQPARPTPATAKPANLPEEQRKTAAALMRVNHAGEVAAQGLYQGHALVARSREMHDHLQHAAEEEYDHLAWCHDRLRELDARPSLLNPAWYAGAYVIGAASALAGDKWGLGFIDETERQVAEHLDGHLQRLPATDLRSRQILGTMKAEEEAHGRDARDAGAAPLPAAVKGIMRAAAAVMKAGAYRI